MKLQTIHNSPVIMSLLLGLAAVPAFGFTVWYFFMRRVTGGPQKISKRERGKPDFPIEYNITNRVILPRVSGRTLAFITRIGHSFIGTAVLGPDSFRKSNYDILRKISIPEEPVFFPVQPFTGDAAATDGKCPVDLDQVIKVEKTKDAEFRIDTVSDFYEAYRSGSVTPMEVAERAIKAIQDSEELKPRLRAVTQYDVEEIKKMAQASTERFQGDSPLSVFDGVPVLVKEEIQTVPYHSRIGTVYTGKVPTDKDATIVRKLREAGAVILGVTNMHEQGFGVTGINPSKIHGTARNPYNTEHCCGGSSAGSASAVAAGLCPVAIGSDAGGSIRIPATQCGVVGLKPTFGRVSGSGCCGSCVSVIHQGPIACCVRDAALAYTLMAGPDPEYPIGLDQPAITLTDFENKDLTGIKVGIDWKYFRDANIEILGVCEKALLYIESLGAKVVEVQIPELEEARVAHVAVCASEIRSGLTDEYNNHMDEMGKDVANSLAASDLFTSTDYIMANKQRTRAMKFLGDIFDKVDCIITPATGKTAIKIHPRDLDCGVVDVDTMNNYMRFVFLGNLLGLPALSVPVGYNDQGLPIGMQIQGKWWNESVILRIGHAAEGFLKKMKPQVHYSLLA
ncbi:uncharacterized protein [Ptychodera flava]|uniref:uncharacterized protein n=1 Tax=Ptychodera flava TaxID=63121 RepID=UPI00396A72BA